MPHQQYSRSARDGNEDGSTIADDRPGPTAAAQTGSTAAVKPAELFSVSYNYRPRAPLSTLLVQMEPTAPLSQSPSSASSASSKAAQPGAPYTLRIQEKENPSQTWIYHGSHDPKTIGGSRAGGKGRAGAAGTAGVNGTASTNGDNEGGSNDDDGGSDSTRARSVILIYDRSKKAFILDELDAQLNFNVARDSSAPGGKPQHLERLDVVGEVGPCLSDDNLDGGASDIAQDDEPDSENPYDWRHFARRQDEQKRRAAQKAERRRSGSETGGLTPDWRARDSDRASPRPPTSPALRPPSALDLRKETMPAPAAPTSLAPSTKSTKAGSAAARGGTARGGKRGGATGVGRGGATARGSKKAAATEVTTAAGEAGAETTVRPKPASRTITDPLRQTSRKKVGAAGASAKTSASGVAGAVAGEGASATGKANGSDKRQGQRQRDDEPVIHTYRAGQVYEDGDIIDIPSMITNAADETTRASDNSDVSGRENGPQDAVSKPDQPLFDPPSQLAGRSGIEVVADNLTVDWGSPPRETKPRIQMSQDAFGFGQVDDDDEGLEHVGLTGLIKAKREEEERRKRTAAARGHAGGRIPAHAAEDDDDNGDDDEGSSQIRADMGPGSEPGPTGAAADGDDADDDMKAALEADFMAAFEDLEAEAPKDAAEASFADAVRAKQSSRVIEEDESSISEEE
ncbi:hypothetical protein KEM52_005180 [Ascosphaera acerosa]|nr:hypothetical protein KEM52_005180 [Ascosphaera acerosa]